MSGSLDGHNLEDRSVPLIKLIDDVTLLQDFLDHLNDHDDPHGETLTQTFLRMGDCRLNGDANTIYIRNADGSEYRDITVRNFTVTGTINYSNSETLQLTDNFIGLNVDYTGSNPVEDCGLEVERGTLENVKFYWDESEDKWKISFPDGSVYTILHTGNQVDLSDYVLKAGDTMTGPLIIENNSTTNLSITSAGDTSTGMQLAAAGNIANFAVNSTEAQLSTNKNYVNIGGALGVKTTGVDSKTAAINVNATAAFINTTAPYFEFNKQLKANGYNGNANKGVNFADPTDPQDVVTLQYFTTNSLTQAGLDLLYLRRDGSNSPTADINWGAKKITNMAEPTNDSDAATKYYADHTTAYYAA